MKTIDILLETTMIPSELRTELNDSQFGLPNDRMYPLDTEDHIKKAIVFFDCCEPSKRIILANNICKKSKELGLVMNIPVNNSFIKYADKAILSDREPRLCEYVIEKIIVETKSKKINKIISDINSMSIYDIKSLLKVINFVQSSIPTIIAECERYKDCNPMIQINVYIDSYLQIYNDFSYYTFKQKSSAYDQHNLILSVIKDIVEGLSTIRFVDLAGFNTIIKGLKDLLCTESIDSEFVSRHIAKTFIDIIHNIPVGKNYTQYKHLQDLYSELSKVSTKKITSFNCKFDCVETTLSDKSVVLQNTINYLESVKIKLKNQIDIIIRTLEPVTRSYSIFTLSTDMDYAILDTLGVIDYNLDLNTIKCFLPDFTNELGLAQQRIIKSIPNQKLFTIHDNQSDCVYVLSKDDGTFIIGSGSNNDLYLLSIDQIYKIVTGMKIDRLDFDRFIAFNEVINNQSVCEGLDVTSNGDVVFTFSKKDTFMNEYSKVHKLLVENIKNKNYEAAKHNLAYIFTIIVVIEREVLYNKSSDISDSKRRDAEKARMFCMNDFKTYLKEIQKAEPKFDFYNFYESNNYDKFTFTVTPDNIKGVKRLLQTILFSH